MSSLFENAGMEAAVARPLADVIRPTSLDEIYGQDHLLGKDGTLRQMLASGRLGSLILWGPPGVGKTTLARLLAQHTSMHFEQLSAIFTGVADLRRIFAAAKNLRSEGLGTLLFIDEIHRFNRSQNDSFLPHMEDGTIVLVGATTENPSFELNAALLSRARVMTLNRLDSLAMEALLQRAEAHKNKKLALNKEARSVMISMADGDGRALLNMAEEIFPSNADGELDPAGLARLLKRRVPVYDKGRDGHYNLISALHKSVRGSDPQAALYWLARMLTAGEDPLYICRRLVRMATEDIGLADPQAVHQVDAARKSYEFLGSPEGELAIAQATIYLACAPKSNAVYKAWKAAEKTARETGSPPPPKHILNAPTKLMKQEGYGLGYIYEHDTREGFSGQNFFPEEIPRLEFYEPIERGFERELAKRLNYWQKLRDSS
jgi:putative ATPase